MSNSNINELLEQRIIAFTNHTNQIIDKFSERLTAAFQQVYNAPRRKIVWNGIDSIQGTDKAILVKGVMSLEIGEIIYVGEKQVLLDQNNINQYNRLVKFAFPIIMLELATTDELIEFINRITKIGGSTEISPEELAKILDNISEEYHNKIVNDPSKVEIFDAVTKPKTVLGFTSEGLTDEQIRKIMLYEKMDLGKIN